MSEPTTHSTRCACNMACHRLCPSCGTGYDAGEAMDRGCDCWCHVADEQRRKTDRATGFSGDALGEK